MLDDASVTNGGPMDSNHQPAEIDDGRDQYTTRKAEAGVSTNIMCDRSQRPARENPRTDATLQQVLQTCTVLICRLQNKRHTATTATAVLEAIVGIHNS